jgi:hypothetical protein
MELTINDRIYGRSIRPSKPQGAQVWTAAAAREGNRSWSNTASARCLAPTWRRCCAPTASTRWCSPVVHTSGDPLQHRGRRRPQQRDRLGVAPILGGFVPLLTAAIGRHPGRLAPPVEQAKSRKHMNVVLRVSRPHGSWQAREPWSSLPRNRLDQSRDTLAAVELTLTQDELRHLDEVSALSVSIQGGCCRSRVPTVWSQLIAGCVFSEARKQY